MIPERIIMCNWSILSTFCSVLSHNVLFVLFFYVTCSWIYGLLQYCLSTMSTVFHWYWVCAGLSRAWFYSAWKRGKDLCLSAGLCCVGFQKLKHMVKPEVWRHVVSLIYQVVELQSLFQLFLMSIKIQLTLEYNPECGLVSKKRLINYSCKS